MGRGKIKLIDKILSRKVMYKRSIYAIIILGLVCAGIFIPCEYDDGKRKFKKKPVKIPALTGNENNTRRYVK